MSLPSLKRNKLNQEEFRFNFQFNLQALPFEGRKVENQSRFLNENWKKNPGMQYLKCVHVFKKKVCNQTKFEWSGRMRIEADSKTNRIVALKEINFRFFLSLFVFFSSISLLIRTCRCRCYHPAIWSIGWLETYHRSISFNVVTRSDFEHSFIFACMHLLTTQVHNFNLFLIIYFW